MSIVPTHKQELEAKQFEVSVLKTEYKILKDKFTKTVAGLQYYANEENWKRSNKALFTRINSSDVEPTKNKEVAQVFYRNLEVGGKTARSVLKEVGILK